MWNAEQVITGGASSSSYSVFGEETDTEAGDDEVTVTEEVRSGTLFELDLLDCPVCCHALTRPVFQVSVLVTFFVVWSSLLLVKSHLRFKNPWSFFIRKMFFFFFLIWLFYLEPPIEKPRLQPMDGSYFLVTADVFNGVGHHHVVTLGRLSIGWNEAFLTHHWKHRYHVFFGKITLTTLVMIRTLSVAFFVISVWHVVYL